MSAPYGLRSREWQRVLAFAGAVREAKHGVTRSSFDEDEIPHFRGAYTCAQREGYGFTLEESERLGAMLRRCGATIDNEQAQGALAAALHAIDAGTPFDLQLLASMPRKAKSAAESTARKTANKAAQRATWRKRNLCPTCGAPPASPAHASCRRCLDAALARKQRALDAENFVDALDAF